MTINRRRFITVTAGAAASIASGAAAAAGNDIVRWRGIALGAQCSIIIAGQTRSRAETAIAAAIAEVRRMEALFSLYRSDSALVRLNQTGRLDGPSPDMLRLLATCATIHRLTGGAFDPTIQPVWRLRAEAAGQPSDDDLQRAHELVGWSMVRRATDAIHFAKPGMALTLNGIAQGYATDQVAQVLKAQGIDNVLVDMGEIAALGHRTGQQPWRVGIAERSDGAAETHIGLTDRAIATSSPLGTMLKEERPFGHIINPNGQLAPSPWRRISVIHRSAAVADGLSTGFCLLSRREMETAAAAAGAELIVV